MTPDVIYFYSFYFIPQILSLTSWINREITRSAFACIVRDCTTERNQVDDNNSTRRAAMSSSLGTYAADFYDPSIPLSLRSPEVRFYPRALHKPATAMLRPLCNSRRDHQRSLSSTNRIWHWPNRSPWIARACQWTRCTCNVVVNRRVRGFPILSVVAPSKGALALVSKVYAVNVSILISIVGSLNFDKKMM